MVFYLGERLGREGQLPHYYLYHYSLGWSINHIHYVSVIGLQIYFEVLIRKFTKITYRIIRILIQTPMSGLQMVLSA